MGSVGQGLVQQVGSGATVIEVNGCEGRKRVGLKLGERLLAETGDGCAVHLNRRVLKRETERDAETRIGARLPPRKVQGCHVALALGVVPDVEFHLFTRIVGLVVALVHDGVAPCVKNGTVARLSCCLRDALGGHCCHTTMLGLVRGNHNPNGKLSELSRPHRPPDGRGPRLSGAREPETLGSRHNGFGGIKKPHWRSQP